MSDNLVPTDSGVVDPTVDQDQPRTATFRFSPRILDHLGVSAYNSLQKCLSELVANAYDADATKVEIEIPDVIEESAIISIKDNGIGMSSDDLEGKFLFIGRNRRADGQRTPRGRLLIGSKGLGKLAGFGIAHAVQVITVKGGKESQVTIDREALEDFKALSEHPLVIAEENTASPNGTAVRLMRLSQELHLPSTDAVRRHLYRALPKRPDFQVLVNSIECTAEDVPGEKHTFTESIPGLGDVTGFYVVANSRQSTPGLAVRVRGRVVSEPSLFGLDTRTHGYFTAEKIVGEINAEFLDPESKPVGTGSQELINTTRDGFLEDSPLVKQFDDWAHGFLRKIIQGVDQTETVKRTNALLDRPAIRTRLESLPTHVRGTATKVVRGLVAKLNNVDDKEAEELIEWILRYYESNVLRELMRAILAAEVQDAEKLGSLVEEWGLKQVGSIVEIIKTQIDIIVKLQELIASEKAKELEVHKLVEANLWLIREGLELWSSDVPLKTLLDEQIDKIYADRQDIRPDLVCRSRNNGNEAVILEFKRPKETITMDHVTQALEYEAIIKKNRPNISFETYIVGRNYHASVLAAKDKLDHAGLHLWSLNEILQIARSRFEDILNILGR